MTLAAWIGTAWLVFFGFDASSTHPEAGKSNVATAFGQVRLGGGFQALAVPDEVVVTASSDGMDWAAFATRHGAAVVREIPALRAAVLRRPNDVASADYCSTLRALPEVASADPNYLAQTTADSCGHSPFLGGDHCYQEMNDKTLARCRIEEARAANGAALPRCTPTGSSECAAEAALERAAEAAPECAAEAAPECAAEAAPAGTILIAVFDTGVDASHEDLSGAIEPGYDFVSDDSDADDDNGHGTLVAGILVANAENDRGVSGIASGRARVLPVKVADRRGCASFAALAAGLTYAADRGARIGVIALGATHGAPILRQAVEYARAKGMCLIAAAGNMKTNTAMFPAAYPGVVCVSAVDAEDRFLLSTNVTSETACAAPGTGIVTTMPGNMYRETRGTSASCSVAAGIAALAWSAAPSRTADEIATLCRTAVDPIPTLQNPQVYSWPEQTEVRSTGAARAGTPAPRGARVPPAPGFAGPITVLPPHLFDFGRLNAAEMVRLAMAPGPIAKAPPVRRFRDALQRRFRDALQSRFHDALQGPAITVERVVCETTPDDPRHVGFSIDFRNVGGLPTGQIPLEARVGDAPVRGPASVPALAPDASATLRFVWDVPASAPAGSCVLALDATLARRAPADEMGRAAPAALEDASAEAPQPLLRYDFAVAVPDPSPLRVQYQQSGGIDIIPDAPYRIVPGRTYVPVQIFVPEKGGGTNPNTFLVLNDVRIQRKMTASDPSPVTIYQDSPIANPTIAPASLTIVDENGVVQTNTNGSPNLNLFRDVPLNVPGRHNILRIPNGSLSVALPTFAPVDRYLDVRVTWSYYENLGVPTLTQTGTTRKVLKITYVPATYPTLPGENHYYDSHVHTVAEWYFTTPDDAFSPRKAWGGPIQMIKESAYAVGLTDSIDGVNGTLITTDHNCFYGDDLRYGNTSPDSIARRPAFGQTSVAQSLGAGGVVKSEWTRMKEIFGVGAAEELTFSQDQQIPYIMPLGAHILDYRSQHIDGPWHGGSSLSVILDPQSGPPILLQDVLTTLASQNPTENGAAFTYAAHPFSKQGWSLENLQIGFGLNGLSRPTTYSNMTTKEFVCRGLQVFNGKSASVFTGNIVWNDLDPWTDAGWQAGNTDWDAELQEGLVKWHEYVAGLMEWSFTSDPTRRFMRKIYVSAGTDAHGDFNYSQGRLATLLDLQASFSLDSSAFGQARTYVYADGKAGATPSEKWMNALEDGNSCITDGPVLNFSMDSDMRFDSQTLSWHDTNTSAENADGRIGGEGAFDGGRTMLVRRGCSDIGFKYRYRTAADVGSANGALSTIAIYRDRLYQPNPTQNRQFGTDTKPQIRAVGHLAVGAPDTDLVETINPNEEGNVTALTALSLGAFTGGDPDLGEIASSEGRCYTNPVWIVPVDIMTSVSDPNTSDNSIPAGGVTVTFLFDRSMQPSAYQVEFKTLSASGSSTASTTAADSGSTNGVWSSLGDLGNVMYACQNASAIPLTAAYPTNDKATVVVYFRDPPLDCNGNAMNSVAKTFTANYTGGGSSGSSSGGSGGSSSGGSTTIPPTALANAQTIANLATALTSGSSGSSSSGGSSSGGGGGGGGGGCFVEGLARRSGFDRNPAAPAVAGMLLVLWALSIRRRS